MFLHAPSTCSGVMNCPRNKLFLPKLILEERSLHVHCGEGTLTSRCIIIKLLLIIIIVRIQKRTVKYKIGNNCRPYTYIAS